MKTARAAEPKRVGIFGNFGSGNFGNDASLESMLLTLRRIAPDCDFCCVCSEAEVVASTFGVDTISITPDRQEPVQGRLLAIGRGVVNRVALWRHAFVHVRRLKALIVPGTGVLDDFGIGPYGWPHNLFCWFLLARLMGVPVLLVSIGAGPIHHPVSRWLMKAAARAARYRSYRDDKSRAFMQGIGFDVSADPLYPDLAFSLPTPPVAAPGGNPLTVGVGLMTYYGWEKKAAADGRVYDTYVAKMATFIRWLLGEGHRVRLLIGDETDNTAIGDVLAALRGSGHFHEDRIVYNPAHSLNEVMRQMVDVDVVVATRFHTVVCALKMARPTISISYAAKNDALLAEMGLTDFCQHIERLDLELLKTQTVRLIAERKLLEGPIRAACATFEAELAAQEDRLSALIGQSLS